MNAYNPDRIVQNLISDFSTPPQTSRLSLFMHSCTALMERLSSPKSQKKHTTHHLYWCEKWQHERFYVPVEPEKIQFKGFAGTDQSVGLNWWVRTLTGNPEMITRQEIRRKRQLHTFTLEMLHGLTDTYFSLFMCQYYVAYYTHLYPCIDWLTVNQRKCQSKMPTTYFSSFGNSHQLHHMSTREH